MQIPRESLAADFPPGTAATRGRANRRVYVLVFFCALAAPLLYAFTTHEVWEDYLITFRFSQNLAEGQGLTYNPPEHVYGFTSPLGVLAPALFHWIIGAADYHPALNVFRAFSAIAYAGAVVLVFDLLRRTGHRVAAAIAAILLIFEPKCLAYGSNGQEAAFMMFGIAALLWLSREPISRRWVLWGLALGFLQWTRPDGFVFGGAVILANLVFASEARRPSVIALTKSAAAAMLIHLPWLIFVWSYYGSPVPQTIIAKSARAKVALPTPLIQRFLSIPELVAAPFQAIYHKLGGWPSHVRIAAMVIGATAALAWLMPVRRNEKSRFPDDRVVRVASLSFMLMAVYFSVTQMDAPWYFPPVAVVGLTAFAPALMALRSRINPALAVAATAAIAAIILERCVYTGEFVRQIAAQQRIIEEGTRKPLGLYIREHASPGDRVFLEPLGYIGYYSKAHMLDYPGLVAPEVTRFVRPPAFQFDEFLAEVKPEWIVFRSLEARGAADNPSMKQLYQLVKTFDSSEAINDSNICGKPLLEFDEAFSLYHRIPAERADR